MAVINIHPIEAMQAYSITAKFGIFYYLTHRRDYQTFNGARNEIHELEAIIKNAEIFNQQHHVKIATSELRRKLEELGNEIKTREAAYNSRTTAPYDIH